MVRREIAQAALMILVLTCSFARPGRSTTFVLMDEQTMMGSSDVVLTGTVTTIESVASDDDGSIQTYITVQPDRIIKGVIGLDPVVVREPGGTVAARSEWVFGAPQFWVGERNLLFLSRNSDGTLQTNSLAMGKFTLSVDGTGRMTAVRDFGEEAAVFVPETGEIRPAVPETQPLAPLLSRLRTLAQNQDDGEQRPRLMLTAPPDAPATATEFHESFTFLGSPPARWFEPDSGQAVSYLVDSTGDQTLGFASSRAAVDAALAVWTNVPTSDLILTDGGTTGPAQFGPCDTNRIVFNDPFNEITNPSGCGGILAIGGYCTTSGTTVVNGTTFGRIAVGKVTFNNGWGGCSFWNQCNVAEVATHEIGHTIGLGHSTDSSATMAATAHFDGRCAGLASDDVAAVSFIYPGSGSPLPTPTPGAAPFPDSCSNATVIDSTPYSGTTSTSSATTSSSDPSPGCGNGSRGKSVWYQFTAPSNGTLTADTFGSNYDTILSAYTGSCGALNPVSGACNDDSGSLQSRVSFQTVGGRTYYFLVTAYRSDGGSLTFHLTFQGTGNTATPTTTATPAPPTPTFTLAPPTATFTPAPPTATATPTFTAGPPTPTSTAGPPTPTFTATATRLPGPPDECTDATIIEETPFSNSVVTSSTSTSSSDPSPACGNRSRGKSVWYEFTAPSNGALTADTFGSNYDTILSAYTGSCGTLSPVAGACNDDSGSLQSRIAFQATGGRTYYFLVTAYRSDGGNLRFNLTFQGTGNTATPTATLTPAPPTATFTPAPPTPTFTLAPPTPTFTLAPPTPTFTEAPPPTSTFTPGPPTATFTPGAPTPTFTQAPPPPTPTSQGGFPDTCDSATVVSFLPFTDHTNTASATTSGSDPSPGCGNRSRGKSVWYEFTAPSDGTVTANTFGSSYDTILSAYRGSCGALSPVAGACNDDSGSLQSRVSFQATAGTTYYFLVTAYRSDGGNLTFQLTFQGTGNPVAPTPTFTTSSNQPTPTFTQEPPPTPTIEGGFPDTCGDAMPIFDTPFSETMSTSSATSNSNDPPPPCGNRSRGKSVWFRFTPPSNGQVTADTFGSSYDTILAAFTGSCGALNTIAGACNDDTNSLQSRVSFFVTGGNTYYFLVTAYRSDGGTLHFQFAY